MPLISSDDVEPKIAEMEHALRKERAPALYERHDVGFEELETSDDGQRAVGIRVFQVGDSIFYAPIFFYRGKLMGDELMYGKTDDLFIPFSEKWVNYILRREPSDIGEQLKGDFDAEDPDLGSMLREGEESEAVPGSERYIKSSHILKSASDIDDIFDINIGEVLKEAGENEKAACMMAMSEFPEVAESLLNRVDGLMGLLKPAEEQEEQDEGKIRGSDVQYLTDKSQAEIVDRQVENYTEPSSVGLYEVVTDMDNPSNTELMLLAEKREYPGTPSAIKKGDVELVRLSDGLSTSKKVGSFLALTKPTESTDWGNWWEDLSGKQLRKHNCYRFVGPKKNQISDEISVEDNIKKSNGQRVIKSYHKSFIWTESKGNLVETEDRVYIPKHWKPIRIKKEKGPNEEFPYLPSPDDVLLKTGSALWVKDASQGYFIECEGEDGKDFVRKPQEVRETLKDKYGLNEKDASDIMSDHSKVGRELFFVKKAQPPMPDPMSMPPGQMPMSPDMPMPQPPMPPGPAGGQPQELAPEAMQAIQSAIEAENSGQQNAIDAGVLSGMLSMSDSGRFIKSNLGSLLEAVDKLGRMLYLIYWNYEDFEEDLGSKDLSELLDMMVNVFNSQGEVILNLKERLSGSEDLQITLG